VLGPIKINSKFLFYIAPLILIATSLVEIFLIHDIQYRNDYRIINLSINFQNYKIQNFLKQKQIYRITILNI